MATTLRDVAARAGASVAAVSSVLNGRSESKIRVARETAERIRSIAAELDYAPNLLARGLVTGKNGLLGLVFPYSSAYTSENPFCLQIMSGVFEGAVAGKVNLMLHMSAGEEWHSAPICDLLDPRTDGIVLVLPGERSKVIDSCIEHKYPYVAVVYDPHRQGVYCVNADDELGGRLAAEHLIELGHRRIAHLQGRPGVSSSIKRQLGFEKAMDAAGIGGANAMVVPSGFDAAHGRDSMERILALPAEMQPTAVFAANDLCAFGVMEVAAKAGMKVPDDLAVVGFDDTWFASMTHPGLTSVHMPIQKMGSAAAAMLLTLCEGKQPIESQIIFPVSLTLRGSTCPRMTSTSFIEGDR